MRVPTVVLEGCAEELFKGLLLIQVLSNRFTAFPIVSTVVPFIGFTIFLTRSLAGNPTKELPWRQKVLSSLGRRVKHIIDVRDHGQLEIWFKCSEAWV